MTWWTSIAFYLWRNSVRRWIEQPLGVLSKLAIAGLVAMLGALMMAGVTFLGEELARKLASRDALGVAVSETVPPAQAAAMLGPEDSEEAGWEGLAEEVLTIYQVAAGARVAGGRDVPVAALRNPESLGYPDTVVLVTRTIPSGSSVEIRMDELRVEAVAMPPANRLLEEVMGEGELVVASVRRLSPLLNGGFTRLVLMQAGSLEGIERAHRVVSVMSNVERRRVTVRSALPLLLQLREIEGAQRYVLLAVTLGTALVLGLVGGALAWMEFREERYLLSLIRSFGVGRAMLLVHAVVENCLVAVSGVLAGLGVLVLVVARLDLKLLDLPFLAAADLWSARIVWVLLTGAISGGLLSCVPVGIGLRKPLGLVLK